MTSITLEGDAARTARRRLAVALPRPELAALLAASTVSAGWSPGACSRSPR